MSKGKVNCDTRVEPHIKEKLEEIAKARKVKRADIQRAAFDMIIKDFEEGEDGTEQSEKAN